MQEVDIYQQFQGDPRVMAAAAANIPETFAQTTHGKIVKGRYEQVDYYSDCDPRSNAALAHTNPQEFANDTNGFINKVYNPEQ
jgi:hypothetical protein